MRSWLVARWTADQRVRFLVAGGWNTLFGYLTFVALYALLHDRLHYLLIGVLSHAIAVVNAFVAHRFFVFRSRGSWRGEFLRFNVAQFSVLGAGLVALWLLVDVGGLRPFVAQAIVTVGAVCVSYVAHRRFSFAPR